jgi:hypothetical protein
MLAERQRMIDHPFSMVPDDAPARAGAKSKARQRGD